MVQGISNKMLMDKEIKNIEDALKHTDSPTEIAAFLTRLAAYTSMYTEMLKELQLIKPKKWLEIQEREACIACDDPKCPGTRRRVKPLSDKKTEITWATTPEGQKEIELESILARINILYRSINRRLISLENEYRQAKSL